MAGSTTWRRYWAPLRSLRGTSARRDLSPVDGCVNPGDIPRKKIWKQSKRVHEETRIYWVEYQLVNIMVVYANDLEGIVNSPTLRNSEHNLLNGGQKSTALTHLVSLVRLKTSLEAWQERGRSFADAVPASYNLQLALLEIVCHTRCANWFAGIKGNPRGLFSVTCHVGFSLVSWNCLKLARWAHRQLERHRATRW